MVKSSENLYDVTNQILIETFERNIKEENNQIAALRKIEKGLKQKIAAETKRIVSKKLVVKNKKLAQSIRKYKSDETLLKKQIKIKERMLQHLSKAYESVKSQIERQQQLNRELDKQLHIELNQLSNSSKRASKDAKLVGFSKVKSLLKGLTRKKKLIEKDIELAERRAIERKNVAEVKRISKKLNKKLNSVQKIVTDALKRKAGIKSKFEQKKSHMKQLSLIIRERLRRIEEKELIEAEKGMVKKIISSKLKYSMDDLLDIESKTGSKTEMKKFLKQVDKYLAKLPKKEIDKFSKSKDFLLYKKIFKKYNLK